VYFAGITPPSSNAVVVKVNPGFDGGPPAAPCPACRALVYTASPAVAIAQIKRIRTVFILDILPWIFADENTKRLPSS
jgi:cytidine deaminase